MQIWIINMDHKTDPFIIGTVTSKKEPFECVYKYMY
jgi:hypothetical protein